jgi:2'-5' RNA ligase
MLQFDTRGIKEEAARESANLGMNGTPSFYEEDAPIVISIQIEKNRRGKNLRTCLQREKAQEQTKNDQRDDLFN